MSWFVCRWILQQEEQSECTLKNWTNFILQFSQIQLQLCFAFHNVTSFMSHSWELKKSSPAASPDDFVADEIMLARLPRSASLIRHTAEWKVLSTIHREVCSTYPLQWCRPASESDISNLHFNDAIFLGRLWNEQLNEFASLSLCSSGIIMIIRCVFISINWISTMANFFQDNLIRIPFLQPFLLLDRCRRVSGKKEWKMRRQSRHRTVARSRLISIKKVELLFCGENLIIN